MIAVTTGEEQPKAKTPLQQNNIIDEGISEALEAHYRVTQGAFVMPTSSRRHCLNFNI